MSNKKVTYTQEEVDRLLAIKNKEIEKLLTRLDQKYYPYYFTWPQTYTNDITYTSNTPNYKFGFGNQPINGGGPNYQ